VGETVESTARTVQELVKEALQIERRIDLCANRFEVHGVRVVLQVGHVVVRTYQHDMGANQRFNQRAKECERSTIEFVLHKAKDALVEVKSMGANLKDLNLAHADLVGQSLFGANCENTVFAGALLDRADFSHACLRGADMYLCSASGTRFRQADMPQCVFIQGRCRFEKETMRGFS
jgi:hypothetical protein